jgi:hypothetical protein
MPNINDNIESAPLHRKTWSFYFALFFIVAVAAFFRLFHISERGIEGIEMVYTRPPFSLLFEKELVYYYVKPGYLFLLFFIGKVFNYSSNTVLYVSAISGILSVIVVYFSARRLFNPLAGLLSAFVLSILPYHIWISRMGMAYSPGILFFSLSLLVCLFSFDENAGGKKRFFLFSLNGLINGIMFTLHPGLIGCTICIFCFDFFRFFLGPHEKLSYRRVIYKFAIPWIFFSIFFFLPILSCEFVIRDLISGNSFLSVFFNVKPTRDGFLYPWDYFFQIDKAALGGEEIWPKWSYGDNLGYDYYIRVLLRETGFFNFFLIVAGLLGINFLYVKKKIPSEQTFFINILIIGFLYWTFNPRIFFERRNFSPMAIPVSLVCGCFLYLLFSKHKKTFALCLILSTLGSAWLSWQYVVVKAKFGFVTDYLREKDIREVMILPGICYPENPLLGNREIQSLNLELYKKLNYGYRPEEIPNHFLKARYLLCGVPEFEILEKKFTPIDIITGDVNRFNDELFSYTFRDVFPWQRIGIVKNDPIYWVYDLKDDSEYVKRAFELSRGEEPWGIIGKINIGKSLEYMGKSKEAEELYKFVIDSFDFSSKTPIVLFEYARLFLKLKKYEESKYGYERVIGSIIEARKQSLSQKKNTMDENWARMAMRESVEKIREIDAILHQKK